MIKYKANNRFRKIEEVVIEKETPKLVVLKNKNREKKESFFDKESWCKYCDSIEEAQQYFIDCYEKKINKIQADILLKQSKLRDTEQDLKAYKLSINYNK